MSIFKKKKESKIKEKAKEVLEDQAVELVIGSIIIPAIGWVFKQGKKAVKGAIDKKKNRAIIEAAVTQEE